MINNLHDVIDWSSVTGDGMHIETIPELREHEWPVQYDPQAARPFTAIRAMWLTWKLKRYGNLTILGLDQWLCREWFPLFEEATITSEEIMLDTDSEVEALLTFVPAEFSQQLIVSAMVMSLLYKESYGKV